MPSGFCAERSWARSLPLAPGGKSHWIPSQSSVSLSSAQALSGGKILLYVRNAEPCSQQEDIDLHHCGRACCRLGGQRAGTVSAAGTLGSQLQGSLRSLGSPPWGSPPCFQVGSSKTRSAVVLLHPLGDKSELLSPPASSLDLDAFCE